jgi:hypothetical protein
MNLRRILVALAITLFLGPGAGHIYLRRFMRGIALILATLASAAHMAWRIGNSLPVNHCEALYASVCWWPGAPFSG